MVSGAHISGLAAAAETDDIGIQAAGSAILCDNRVLDTGAATGGGATYGIHASSDGIKMLGNVVSVAGTAYVGGTQVPGSNH